MTVHIDYDGTIKLDNCVVVRVMRLNLSCCSNSGWFWRVHVNGSRVVSGLFETKAEVFRAGIEHCHREAAVIR